VLEAQGPEAKKNRFLFAGRYYISEGGVYDFRARVLDGRLGRFLEREPLLGERMRFLSMYSYSRNNPVNFKDTTGLYFESVRNRVVWMISELLKVGCISNSNVRRDWSCQISFRTFSEFEHSVKIIFYALTSLQSATWRYGKVLLPNFAGIAQNAFNNDFLPKFKEGLKIMITSEKSKFRGTISRWWVRRSTMDFFTDEFFKISEQIIDQLCENVIVIEIDLRRIIKRLATMVWTPWEFKWLTDVFGKELEKFINDFISLFKDGYSIKIMVPIPAAIRLIAALFGRLLPEETPFNITRLGPLSYLFIAYFETLLFHPSDLAIHREIKYEILKKFCNKLKRFYPELTCAI